MTAGQTEADRAIIAVEAAVVVRARIAVHRTAGEVAASAGKDTAVAIPVMGVAQMAMLAVRNARTGGRGRVGAKMAAPRGAEMGSGRTLANKAGVGRQMASGDLVRMASGRITVSGQGTVIGQVMTDDPGQVSVRTEVEHATATDVLVTGSVQAMAIAQFAVGRRTVINGLDMATAVVRLMVRDGRVMASEAAHKMATGALDMVSVLVMASGRDMANAKTASARKEAATDPSMGNVRVTGSVPSAAGRRTANGGRGMASGRATEASPGKAGRRTAVGAGMAVGRARVRHAQTTTDDLMTDSKGGMAGALMILGSGIRVDAPVMVGAGNAVGSGITNLGGNATGNQLAAIMVTVVHLPVGWIAEVGRTAKGGMITRGLTKAENQVAVVTETGGGL